MLSPQQEVVLDGELSLNLNIDGDMSLDIPVDGEAGTVIKVTEHDLPVYTGQTEITPSEDTQLLQTANKTVVQDIIINPIPSNYGLITWNGSTLTVS
jgi:hypothetical protein